MRRTDWVPIIKLVLIIAFDFCNVSPRQSNHRALGWVIYSASLPETTRKRASGRCMYICSYEGIRFDIYLYLIKGYGVVLQTEYDEGAKISGAYIFDIIPNGEIIPDLSFNLDIL